MTYPRRLKILVELLPYNWRLQVCVVDQRKLTSPLTEFNGSFIKYFQKIFLNPITENYKQFEIQFDKTGGVEFQRSLISYMDNHVVKRDLFNLDRAYTLHDEKAEKNILLCFTDLFTNSIGQYFCISNYKEESKTFVEQIISKTHVEYFPFQETYDNRYNSLFDKEIDDAIYSLSLSLAQVKLNELSQHDIRLDLQVLLGYFILNYRLNSTRLLPLAELTDHLNIYYPGTNDDRTRVLITELRNLGVLIITSKGKWGFKLPNTLDDFDMYFKRLLDSIIPMIKRIGQYQSTVLEKSGNQIDLLKNVDNSYILNQLLLTIKKTN